MGWLGKLFGAGGPRKPPAWARDAFATDGAKFDSFVDVVLDVLERAGHAASEMDVRTGSVLVREHEWLFHRAAAQCASTDPTKWRGIVERSLSRLCGPVAGVADEADDADDADDADEPHEPATRAWIIGAASWGVMFECEAQAVVVLVLPTIDRSVQPEPPPPGLVKRVIVCNTGDEGYLAATAIARAAGLAQVFAIDPQRPIDRGGEPGDVPPVTVRALTKLEQGSLTLERRGCSVHGTWRDGVTFLAGDAIPMSLVVDVAPAYAVGKFVFDKFDDAKLVAAMRDLRRVLIVGNVPGLDATRLGELISMFGVTAEVMNGATTAPPVSPMTELFALMVMGDLERADAIAVGAIASGDSVDDMRYQRAMIALMRGDDPAADAELAQLATPQSLSSRAIIAAKRGDPAAREFANRAVAGLPGDVIALRAAICVYALAGDREGAHSLLAEHAAVLDPGVREALDRAIDDPEALTETVAHRFPGHAQQALAAVSPLVDAGDFAAAEPLLRRATAWDPDHIGITAELGFTLAQQNKDDEAIAVYRDAIARGGPNHLLRFNRGNCQIRRQRFAEAAIDFRVCLELKPDWHEARINLTSALFAAGDAKAAKAEVTQLERLGGPKHHIATLRQMIAGKL